MTAARKGSSTRRALVKLLVLAGVLAAVVIATIGTTASAKPAATKVLIGWSDPLASEEGLRAVGYGERRAIAKLGLAGWVVKELDAKLSADKQVADIDTFISLGAKAITSWSLDPGALDPAYKRARDKGIPVIGINTFSKYHVSVVAAFTDTTCIVANEQAKYIAKLVPRAKLLVMGGPPAPSIKLTTDCFVKAAKKEGLRILDQQDDLKGTQENGQKVAQSMLIKHPDVEAFWVFSDNTGLGASAALRAAGKSIWSGNKKGVVLISRNGVQAAIDAIKTGNLTASWDNEQPQVGSAALQLLKYILVDKAPLSAMPKTLRIPSKRWDITNAGQYVGLLKRSVPLLLPKKFPGKFPATYSPKLVKGFGS